MQYLFENQYSSKIIVSNKLSPRHGSCNHFLPVKWNIFEYIFQKYILKYADNDQGKLIRFHCLNI